MMRHSCLSQRLLVPGLLVALLASAGCSIGPASPTPEPKGGGGEFRVVMAGEPISLNPDLRADDAAFVVAQNVYNKLVTLDADYRVIPDLARAWEVSADGLTYTFRLATGVLWHDGQPFTSADAKWTLQAIADSKGVAASTAAMIASIDTPDAATLVVKLKDTWAPFIPNLAWYGTFILPRHLYEGADWTQNPANQKPVGTGPFKFVEWLKGDRVTLSANTSYFRQGPYMDKVSLLFLKDPSAAFIPLLASGEVDFSQARPAFDRLAELQRASGVKVQTFAHPARYYLGFNVRRKPFDDVRVRQALNAALNRNEIVEKALQGYGAPGVGFYTPALAWAYNAQARVPVFDTAAAERLLDEAGLPRGAAGVRLRVALLAPDLSPYKEIGQAVQSQLNAVGLTVDLQIVSTSDWTRRAYTDLDFDMALNNGSWGPDPENLALRAGSKGAGNFMGYASAEFDAAVAEGGRLVQTSDRARAYGKAQEILARDLPIAPLAEYVQILTYRANITGLPQMEARGLVTFNDFSLVRRR
jgi:peptide/nickel transport system substrate-binding protein